MNAKPKPLALVLAGAALLLLAVVLLWPARGPGTDPYADRAKFAAAVREAIQSNPEMIVEALQALQDRQKEVDQLSARATLLASKDALERDPNSFVGGNPQGDVTVVEFYDYRCPYCRQAHAVVRDLLKADPNVRFVYKEFPILGPESLTAARAAVAARKSKQYEAFHDALITHRGSHDEATVMKIAADVGINVDALQVEMRAPETDEIIRANHALAQSLGINGTPAFIVGDSLVPGVASLDELKGLIAKARAAQKG